MKVFISWSGQRSLHIATAIRDWLPNVIQAVDPWISAKDIEKGARWQAELALELEASQVGIICLTKDNVTSPWLLYEAGAIAKTLNKSFVCPYLYDIRPSDITGPLSQFQATLTTRDDTFKLVKTINDVRESDSLTERTLTNAFEKFWPDLKAVLETIPESTENVMKTRSDREILEEVLELMRSLMYDKNGTDSSTPSQSSSFDWPGSDTTQREVEVFFKTKLMPEARLRAMKEYEGISLSNATETILNYGLELASAAAKSNGLENEWDSWLLDRRGTS